MSQVSYGTITINDLTDITDVYLEYALVSDTIIRAEDIPSSTQWSTTYPTWVSGQQIWIRRVTCKEGIDTPEYGTPYLDKAVGQIQNNYIGLSNKLRTFFYPGDSTYSGAFAVSKTSTDGLDTTNANTYGFNARVASALISMGYNKIPLLEMGLLGDNFNGIKLYSPILTNNVITGNRLDATLTSDGLKLLKGGIEGGGTTSGNGYVYLSTEDKAGITINGYTPGNSDPKWRQIIGTKFGVDSEGNLYANGAHVVNINASNINTGYLNAERIEAGSLTLGQVNGLKQIMSDLEDSVYGVTTYVYEHQDTSTSEMISEVVYLDNSGTEPRYYYISDGVEYEVSESQLKTEIIEGQTQLVTITTNITTDISTQIADFNDSINSELATLNRTVNNYLGTDGYINLVTDGSEPCIIIGQGEFFVKITNTEMGFYQRPENTTSIEEDVDGVTKVAWISSNELVISQSQIKDRQQIGDFIWEVRETTNGYKISLKHNKRTGENNE